jgi:peroxiredoxin Q/BCP
MLLTDESGEVLEKYEVLKNKKMFGKEVKGIERSTFVFNKFGELVKEFRNVKPGPHPEEVLEYIKENLTN